MKIVHIAPNAPYNENWGYQENLLPKYQCQLGHAVSLIVSTCTFENGKIVDVAPIDYVSDHGIRVIRLPRKEYAHRVITSLNSKLEVYPYLVELAPDYVFYHGLSGTTIYDVVKYKKEVNPSCVIVRDNHLDNNNCPNVKGWRGFVVREFQRFVVKQTMPYVNRVYGVTPCRKKFAEDYFGVSSSKTDVLFMGADDEQVNLDSKSKWRADIRKHYGIRGDDFLVVTGGKIDAAKNIHLLMEACKEIVGVKLLVFGNVSDNFRAKFESVLAESNNILYVGWVDSSDVYKYFFAADLVCFPGGHSVMWEQACASKVPCVFKRWEGMEHVNNGGNSDFIDDVSVEVIRNKIQSLNFTESYYIMKHIAESNATNEYLYSYIANKSLECTRK